MDLGRASRLCVALLAAVVLGAGCSHIPGLPKSAATSPPASASPGGTPLAKATGPLDTEVPMPSGFPADVPIYPKARLTAAAPFVSTGQTAWGMEWETTDAPAKVQAYYLKQFNQGDWTLTVSPTPSPNAVFSATIARKSNSSYSGKLALNDDAGVTMIDLSLVSFP